MKLLQKPNLGFMPPLPPSSAGVIVGTDPYEPVGQNSVLLIEVIHQKGDNSQSWGECPIH